MQWLDQIRKLINDLTPFLTALSPILVGYWTYKGTQKPSEKEKREEAKKETNYWRKKRRERYYLRKKYKEEHKDGPN